MLDLTMGGQAVGGEAAVHFLEALPDMLDNAVKTEDFCNEYERVLNRVRFEVRKSVPTPPKVTKGRFTSYSCGQCGFCLDAGVDRFCPDCGRAVNWKVR